MRAAIDILIPTYRRPAALAVTLAGLCAQTYRDFRVIISDQTEQDDPTAGAEVQTLIRVLEAHGHTVQVHKNLPRRGIAQQRQFLLEQSSAPYVLYLDNDLLLEPDIVGRLWDVMQREQCGFVGCGPIGLSYRDDVRPHEQHIEFWDGPVQPETVRPDTPQWERYKLHNAANLYHVQQQLGLTAATQRPYRVAWVAACVLYDAAKLHAIGGYQFWRDLPPDHSGEDVLVQVRLMARYGGCGLLPSGVYHLELPTTIENRRVDAPTTLSLDAPHAREVAR
ncbi:MAG: glycosyltransferase family 2 protein [Chloroflexaceae bacterium]|nr:glycosyltransferase family 2 protein [Chloroflexaceae bacterium]NJO04118.1 glycosyltransferase family 2 protein [Chloroflexaceae bacterium]